MTKLYKIKPLEWKITGHEGEYTSYARAVDPVFETEYKIYKIDGLFYASWNFSPPLKTPKYHFEDAQTDYENHLKKALEEVEI